AMFRVVGLDFHPPIMDPLAGDPNAMTGTSRPGRGLFRRVLPYSGESTRLPGVPMRRTSAVLLAACMLAAPPLVHAQQATDVPVCQRSLGSLAVVEPTGQNWWTGQRLP